MNWAALDAFLRAARSSARLGAEPPPEPNALQVDAWRVFAYRAHAMYLDRRIASLTDAAYAGLQDSAPRSALLSLHARVENVEPSSWEHPSLAQIWFRLGADYVVPRAGLGVFTLGTMPRDRDQAAALNELGDMVVRALGGKTMRTRDVDVDLPNPMLIRASNVSGKVNIRWDARTTEVVPVGVPSIDPEDARLELARRFLHWLGPAGPAHLARWAAVPKKDALATWDAIRAELVPVDFDGRGRWILASDEKRLSDAQAANVVRLLPMGDPYLYLDTAGAPKDPELAPDVTQRLINSLAGRVLLDGELVGSWGRVQADVTIFPWVDLSEKDRDRIAAEAMTFEVPMGRQVRLRWLS
jgi:hypothetical protein